jgi:hypothetical protein
MLQHCKLKRKNLTATNSLNTLNNSLLLNLNIGTGQTFQIRDTSNNTMYYFGDSTCLLYRQLNLNNNKIINLAEPTLTTDATTRNYVDTQTALYLKRDGTNAMSNALNMGTYNIFNAGTIAGTSLSLSTGSNTTLLNSDGSINSTKYTPQTSTALIANSVPYINSSLQVATSSTNKLCQSGVDDLNTVLPTLTGSLAYQLQLSAGSFTNESTLIISQQNVLISGTPCPLFSLNNS